MSKQDLLKVQSCVLKVNIHCDGCEQKVKKLLQKIDGVYSVRVDADEGKVVVAGDVDPAKLVKKLKRGGKHAEICQNQKGEMMCNQIQNYPINPQFQNMQLGIGGKDNNNNHKGQKEKGTAAAAGQLAHFPILKGVQDLKVPAKEQKSVKFNLPEEDEFDASDDGYDEDGLGHGHPMQNKIMPMMINHNHKDNSGGSRNINGSVKKADVIDQAMLFKGKGGNFDEAEADNDGGKKGSSSQKDEIKKGDLDKPKAVGEVDFHKKKNGKSENGLLGRFLGFGKKSKKGELEETTYTNKSKNQNSGAENKKGKEGKLEDHGNNDFDFHDYDDTPPHPKNGKSGKGSNNVKEGQMGPGPIMGNNLPMRHQMENIQAVQGLPAMNGDGGYYQGVQMQHAPYNNLQQHYMGMMMNQHQHQQANMNNNMYPTPMMYGRPHPSMNYMPPPPMPSHPIADPITHTFSDENVESCSIM
ncbi:hypothetical protein AAZX31_03G219500 [Glycine max]|uniref:HMA domain-containing protein n=2 Tax=Glycine subgen. Soja TaxID=1462606 RepID=K7KGQ2_SOYBN|nr:heavy metal-associated isoprenylated plant protein 34 isoform X2 [Glycine max]XP_028226604.1 heavy metal-associated isoprenylated plant protein 34-like isoform X2 [Glycine soja]KHN04012.1 hypothetical protein glysoja_022698 [Glycine soja]KRH68585.1 hypothetical protein GLYMA_03G239800v4 [Glycine max]RZC22238.1 Heavy metal-associated isoprenylated plant protein 32 isoform A [Glycine soja]|eukprot:XP_003520816.1 heavy metal-associated isoprenylated plant protein 34 isoform X2 [Glycine max]